MTPTQRKALEQALECLHDNRHYLIDRERREYLALCDKAIDDAEAALAEQQEPVAWKHDCAALLTNDFELWIDACPHCGKPRPAPQPAKPAEQEPVAAQHRFRHPQKVMPDWSVWQPCKVAQRPAWEIDSQGYEVEYRALYPAPQPRRNVTYVCPVCAASLEMQE